MDKTSAFYLFFFDNCFLKNKKFTLQHLAGAKKNSLQNNLFRCRACFSSFCTNIIDCD